MRTALQQNIPFADLYGASILPFVSLPSNATAQDIKAIVSQNKIIGYQHYIMVGERCVIAETKYTWAGRVAKTSYLHIWHVKDFESKKVFTHWREQKDGTFKIQ